MNGYNDFINRFGVKNVQVSRDRDYRILDYNYTQTASYYANREETVEMEISRSGFENLIKLEREYDLLWQDKQHEAYMRRQYPAIKEAYEKYLMLLELYR
jgi:hypothetical protein